VNTPADWLPISGGDGGDWHETTTSHRLNVVQAADRQATGLAEQFWRKISLYREPGRFNC
jgi:hypothetical protein